MNNLRFAVSALLLLCLMPVGLSATTDDYGYNTFSSRDGQMRWLDTFWDSTVLPDMSAEGLSPEIELPFLYSFYGRTYDSVVIHEDGWIGLVPAGPASGDMGGDGNQAIWRELLQGNAPTRPEPTAFLEALHTDWVHGANSRVQYQDMGRRFVVRWIRMTTADGLATASFEAILHEEGGVTFQYLEIRDPQNVLEGADRGTRPPLGDGTDLTASGTPLSGGLTESIRPPRRELPPDVQYLPGDCPDIDGDTLPDNNFPSWCDINPASCSLHAGQPAECLGEDCTPCDQQESTVWRFDEDAFCAGCVYTYFILVECGTEMHIPFTDMEGARIRIFDALTGDPLGIRAENQCYKDSINPNPPFPVSDWYCNLCPTGIIPRADAIQQFGTDCPDAGFPTMPCDIYEEDTTPADPEVCWGANDNCQNSWPAPPCLNSTLCPGGSGANPGHEAQETDVVLTDQDGLCGVFRFEIVSGGFEWFLFANCIGDDSEQFRIFRNCGDALAAWNPLPEYILDDIQLTGDCPTSPSDPNRPAIEVTVRNIGCCDETSDPDSNPCQVPAGQIPVSVFFEDPDNPGTTPCPGPNADLSWPESLDAADLKQKSGTTAIATIPYNCDADTLPVRAIVTLDPTGGAGNGAVEECSEAPGAASCGSLDIAVLDVDVCACDYFLGADLSGPSDVCIFEDPSNPGTTIGSIDLDATQSTSNPSCPNPEFRFYRLDFAEINNPDPAIRRIEEVTSDPANPVSAVATDVTFPCAEGENYAFELEFACADEVKDPVNCPKLSVITGTCGTGDPVEVTADLDFDNDPERETICADQLITMTPQINGSAPIAPVNWRAELRDCSDTATPGPDFPDALANCTQNAHELECDGVQQGIACGDCIAYIAETLNQRDCEVTDYFIVEVTDDPQPVVACNLRVNKGDYDAQGDDHDLEFRHEFPSPPILCPGTPSSEIVEYACTGSNYSTCGPNGLAPGNGEFDLTNMEADGTVVASVDGGLSAILYEDAGVFSGQTTVTYFQVRALNACEGPGPLGLGGSAPGTFGCR